MTADHAFCVHHIATRENPAGTDCLAHLVEGRVFACPYASILHAKASTYPCEDAEAKEGSE